IRDAEVDGAILGVRERHHLGGERVAVGHVALELARAVLAEGDLGEQYLRRGAPSFLRQAPPCRALRRACRGHGSSSTRRASAKASGSGLAGPSSSPCVFAISGSVMSSLAAGSRARIRRTKEPRR